MGSFDPEQLVWLTVQPYGQEYWHSCTKGTEINSLEQVLARLLKEMTFELQPRN